jgi:DNA-binding HxlR family transcriptional regulator
MPKSKSTAKASPAPAQYRQLEDVVGCKWSVSVLVAIGAGVQRPGALERAIDGISTKVLSERLRKLHAYGLIAKDVQDTRPPRTDYTLTSSGAKLLRIINELRALDDEIGCA